MLYYFIKHSFDIGYQKLQFVKHLILGFVLSMLRFTCIGWLLISKIKINHTFQRKIKERIERSVRRCARSLFIFDETDMIPAGLELIETLATYLDNTVHKDGTDYRSAMFLFIR